jgi:penicillin-binding protein 2
MPYLNPNDFVDGSFEERRYYYEDTVLTPQVNRAISSEYPPGSTFKMITQIAALASGNVSLNHTVSCQGAYWRPPFIRCIGVHGTIGFYRSLAVSCNTYAQDIAFHAGIDSIVDIGQQFGLGMRSGLDGASSPDLIGERPGLLPSPEWKRNISDIMITGRYESRRTDIEQRFQTLRGEATTLEEVQEIDRQKNRELANLEAWFRQEHGFQTRWHNFDTFNTSIGQGSVNLTVLQLANFTATIANGGTRFVPRLIDRIETPQGEIVMQYEPIIAGIIDVSPEILEATIRGMYYTSHRSFGTANHLFRHFPPHITVASKTGTSETGRASDGFHGVFVAFAPVDDPQIAIAVLVEYGRSGGRGAGPVARAVFEQYFGLNH